MEETQKKITHHLTKNTWHNIKRSSSPPCTGWWKTANYPKGDPSKQKWGPVCLTSHIQWCRSTGRDRSAAPFLSKTQPWRSRLKGMDFMRTLESSVERKLSHELKCTPINVELGTNKLIMSRFLIGWILIQTGTSLEALSSGAALTSRAK